MYMNRNDTQSADHSTEWPRHCGPNGTLYTRNKNFGKKPYIILRMHAFLAAIDGTIWFSMSCLKDAKIYR